MNDCEKYQEMISCLVDGELSEEDKAKLDAHIAVCAQCASLLKIYRGIFTSPDPQTGSVEPPAELVGRVMERISGTGKTKPKRSFVLYRILPAVACLAIALLVIPRLPLFAESKNDAASVERCADSGTTEEFGFTGEAEDDMADGAYNTAAQDVYPSYMTGSAIAGLEGYCAYVELTGSLPELLDDYEMTDDGYGTLYTYIPESMGYDLEILGYTVVYVSECGDSGQILVLYTP